LRHNFITHFVWELPGQSMQSGWKHIIGGWQANGILSIRSGFPFTVTQGGDLNTGFGARPDIVGDPTLDNPTRALWFNPQAFQRVTCNIPNRQDLCRFGSAGYNILDSRGQQNLDFALFKNFMITERVKLQFRSEFTDAFNTPYFGDPNGLSFTTNDTIVPNGSRMGEIRSLRAPMRIIQFGLKLFF
jgi:hypothetical protein